MLTESVNIEPPKEVWIIVWTDGTIESIWSTERAAKLAIETHAQKAGMPESYYHIVRRKLDRIEAL